MNAIFDGHESIDWWKAKLTVGAHGFSQLQRHCVELQILLAIGLDFHGVRSDDLLDLARLEAHLGLSHDLRLWACQWNGQYNI